MKSSRCILTALGAAAVPAFAAETPSAPPPNIIFILADDLGYGELGCYGQQKIRTPNLDRLAAEGMRFTRHYSGAPVCAPSRGVLLTGRHLGHAEIRGNRQASLSFPNETEGQHPLTAAARTVAQVLREGGYATAAFGKWGLGPTGSTGDPNRQGFDLFFGYNCQAVAHSYYPACLWSNDTRVVINRHPVPGDARAPRGEVRADTYQGETYAPDRMMEEALAFIRANANRPYFLYLPMIEPHVALQAPPDLVATYPPEWDPRPYRGENGYLPHPRPRAAYAALITDLDRKVGQVLRAVEETGVAGRTVVIFTSDNGPTHGTSDNSEFFVGGADPRFFDSTAGLRGYKGSVYEGGLRVPLIVRWPGRIRQGVCAFPCYFADWFPTLCAAAVRPAPPGLDGVNLWPLLTGQSAAPRRNPMVWVFTEYGGQVAVCTGRFKMLRGGLEGHGEPQPWEVYDLEADPKETRNLAAQRPDLVAQARAILSQNWDDNPIFPLDRRKALGN